MEITRLPMGAGESTVKSTPVYIHWARLIMRALVFKNIATCNDYRCKTLTGWGHCVSRRIIELLLETRAGKIICNQPG